MSRYFENELIEQIKDANDIVSVISEHVALKKRGKNYWGCCPFHNERRRPLVLPLKRAFIIVLAVMHREMSLNSSWN